MPPSPTAQAEAQLFTVRVWRQQAQFRAVLQAVGEEQGALFTEAAAVADFLQRASAGAAAVEAQALTPPGPPAPP